MGSADEFVAHAIRSAQAANAARQDVAPGAGPTPPGVFVVGSHITVITNVSSSQLGQPADPPARDLAVN